MRVESSTTLDESTQFGCIGHTWHELASDFIVARCPEKKTYKTSKWVVEANLFPKGRDI